MKASCFLTFCWGGLAWGQLHVPARLPGEISRTIVWTAKERQTASQFRNFSCAGAVFGHCSSVARMAQSMVEDIEFLPDRARVKPEIVAAKLGNLISSNDNRKKTVIPGFKSVQDLLGQQVYKDAVFAIIHERQMTPNLPEESYKSLPTLGAHRELMDSLDEGWSVLTGIHLPKPLAAVSNPEIDQLPHQLVIFGYSILSDLNYIFWVYDPNHPERAQPLYFDYNASSNPFTYDYGLKSEFVPKGKLVVELTMYEVPKPRS